MALLEGRYASTLGSPLWPSATSCSKSRMSLSVDGLELSRTDMNIRSARGIQKGNGLAEWEGVLPAIILLIV